MKNTITKLEKSKFQLDVEVEEAAWKAAQEKAFRKLASKIVLPGFRPGKAPEAMLRQRVDFNQVINNALDDILNPAFVQALEEAKIHPLHNPDVNVLKISDTELTLRFTVVTTPEVKLGAYTGFAAELASPSVTDEEVSESIAKLLEGNADLVVTENPAKLGDTVVLDFEGFVDDQPFEGGQANNYSLELGSNSFIPGFEDALVGVKAGETRDVNVTFPTQYVATLAGKPAKFVCTIHEVKEKVVPALSDESVAGLDIEGVTTVEQLKEHQKAELLKQKVDAAERAHYEAILDQIVAAAEVEIADEIIDGEVAREQENTKKQVEQNGLTFQQYLEVLGKTEEQLREEIKTNVVKNLKSYLVTMEICTKENLHVSDAELDVELTQVAMQYNMPLEQLKSIYGSNIESFRDSLRQKKLQDFLLANNK